MKKAGCLFIALLLCFGVLLSGCTPSAPDTSSEGGAKTVVDMSGNTIKIPETIERYAVIWTGAADLVAMFDGCEHMVGYPVTTAEYPWFFDVYPETKTLPTFPKENVSVESVIESGAQVAFVKASDDQNLVTQLNNAGIAAVDVEFTDYESLKDAVKLVADVFGTDEAAGIAEKYCAYVDDAVDYAEAFSASIPEEDKMTALVFKDASSLSAYGAARFPGQWVSLCGAQYAMVNEDPYPNVILTSEQIIEYNPDYIFFVIPGESAKFCSDSAYRTLNAVANNHVYDDPCGLNSWSNAGTESILQFKWAISIFYPDLVDYDIIEETRDFYEQFYGYTPTEQEINDILNVSF